MIGIVGMVFSFRYVYLSAVIWNDPVMVNECPANDKLVSYCSDTGIIKYPSNMRFIIYTIGKLRGIRQYPGIPQ